jgi:anti-sigma regulatory factor (Ser/Thr protein kinase)
VARKALTSLNGSLHLISEEGLRDAQLLVSELISNAIGHSGPVDTPFHLRVRATPQSMRVDVVDAGSGFDPDAVMAPARGRGGGWGLHIVSSLAHRWGVERGRQTAVWFEIDRPRSDTPLAARPIESAERQRSRRWRLCAPARALRYLATRRSRLYAPARALRYLATRRPLGLGIGRAIGARRRVTSAMKDHTAAGRVAASAMPQLVEALVS